MAGFKHLLLIGNGFDLDIEYQTKYSDYAQKYKQFWPFNNATEGLGGYLQYRAKTDEWLDLESALLDYASANNGEAKKTAEDSYLVDSDMDDFEMLVSYLQSYIMRIIDEDAVNNQSVAAKVLRAILDAAEHKIYSFNYTNLKRVAYALFVKDSRHARGEYELEYVPIHGCIDNNDIILGVNPDAKVTPGYELFLKKNQPNYHPNDLQQDLELAQDITFFGLSMGKIDYPYFKNLFGSLCTGVVPKTRKKYITLFTRDETSRLSIFRQLSELTNTDLFDLQNNCYFEIIRTNECNGMDYCKFQDWLKRQSA